MEKENKDVMELYAEQENMRLKISSIKNDIDNINFLLPKISKLQEQINQLIQERTDFEKLRDEVQTINEKIDFMKKRLHNEVESEFRVLLSQEGFRQLIYNDAENIIKNKISDLIEKIVNKLINKFIKKLKIELNLTKDLCYSINAEVKHFLRSNNFSYVSDKLVVEMIDKKINNFFSGLKLKDLEEIKVIGYDK